MRVFLVLCCLMAVLSAGMGEYADYAAAVSDATGRVLDKLSVDYDRGMRPTVNGDPTIVDLNLYVADMELDDVTMNVRFDLHFRMTWDDPRLTYSVPASSSSYYAPPIGFRANVRHVQLLDPKLVWTPDVSFKDAVTIPRSSFGPETYMRVQPNGKILYSNRLTLQKRCPMNLAMFPHDTQTCQIEVATFWSSAHEVNFTARTEAFQVFQDSAPKGFHLRAFGQESCYVTLATGEYSCAKFIIAMSRLQMPYVLRCYLPAMTLVALSNLAFLIPSTQFLPRLLVVLLPLLLHVYAFNHASSQLIRLEGYGTAAYDVFAGVSATLMFATLAFVVVDYLRESRAEHVDTGRVYKWTTTSYNVLVGIVVSVAYGVFVVSYTITCVVMG